PTTASERSITGPAGHRHTAQPEPPPPAGPRHASSGWGGAPLEHNHHLIRTGQILLADKGFAGKGFKQLTDAMGLTLLRPDRKDETYRNGDLGGVRQWIESVNQTLKGQLDLEDHAGRTPTGVLTHIAQRLLAMAAGIWHNWTTGITSKRSLTAYDH
ncbi:MAG: hypothetical protein ACRDRR_25255, partial [Pseudonocardiaceae bacterium]